MLCHKTWTDQTLVYIPNQNQGALAQVHHHRCERPFEHKKKCQCRCQPMATLGSVSIELDDLNIELCHAAEQRDEARYAFLDLLEEGYRG